MIKVCKRLLHTLLKPRKCYIGHPGFGHLDVRHEGMKGIFDGSINLYVHAKDYRAITEVIHLSVNLELKTW